MEFTYKLSSRLNQYNAKSKKDLILSGLVGIQKINDSLHAKFEEKEELNRINQKKVKFYEKLTNGKIECPDRFRDSNELIAEEYTYFELKKGDDVIAE